MEKLILKRTVYLHLIVSALLDSHLKEIQGSVDAEEFDEFRRVTGRIMGEIYTTVLSKIWSEHNDLNPTLMGGDFEVDNSVQEKAVSFVEELLNKLDA
ncbi:hypothetical protein L4C38_18180 [Vibrio kasasachensis]|uniref:hypothetical protein n=1 Tax=Vibrio kasasachensis TaxID=2910248 RepID=UPI003D14157E